MGFADLHLHTNFSDSTYSPAQLVLESAKSGLSAIAIVDHDTVKGIPPALEESGRADIEVIPGVELSAELENKEVHILGYLIDYNKKGLLERLEVLNKNRLERIHRIADKLKGMGVNLEAEEVFSLAGHATVGRLHVARALMKRGFVGSIFEAFQKYIGDNCPAFELGFKFSPQEAIRLIKDARGIPVLAHPYILHNDDLILDFIKEGLMGIEVYYPEHSQSMVNFYLDLAKQNNLLVTGGSDCHGTAKPGISIGCVKVPYELVEKLKEAKNFSARETKP